MTLPIVGVLSLVLWFVVPDTSHLFGIVGSYDSFDYGLWRFVPSFLLSGLWGKIVGVLIAAIAIYFMAELNNENVLLRISSRMLSSMLAALLAISVPCHIFQPGGVVMILILLSFFPLFKTYQSPSPVFSLILYLHISVASLVFPKILYITPLYWFLQGYMRSLSLKSFVASIIGIIAPYWFFLGIEIYLGNLPSFMEHVNSIVDIQWVGYAVFHKNTIVLFAFMLLLFVSGTFDFYRNSFLDKTRTRIIYNVVVLHAISIITFIMLQPQYFFVLYPVFVVDTSIMFGHFISLTYNRFTHIYCIVLALVLLAMMALRYFV